MAPGDETDTSTRGRRSKVARLIDEYDLDGIGEELEQRWTADENRSSLRELAAYFNQQLLKHQCELQNVQVVDEELETIYTLLTSEDDDSPDRMRVRRRLARDGIDVDTLEADFVTYQAIRTYLKDHRGANYTVSDQDPIEREQQNLQQLRGRVVSVTESKIEQLQNSGDLSLDNFRVLVDIQVVCEDCNSQYNVFDLLEQNGCACDETSP